MLLCHRLALRFLLAAQLVGSDAGLFPLGLAALLETLLLHLMPLFECRPLCCPNAVQTLRIRSTRVTLRAGSRTTSSNLGAKKNRSCVAPLIGSGKPNQGGIPRGW
jgi:hypothetical protein